MAKLPTKVRVRRNQHKATNRQPVVHGKRGTLERTAERDDKRKLQMELWLCDGEWVDDDELVEWDDELDGQETDYKEEIIYYDDDVYFNQ